MKRFKLLNDKGFMLVEIILSIAIIAIGMFAVMSLAVSVIKGNAQSKRLTTATTLAQDKMENILKMDYGSVTSSFGTYTDNINYYWETNVQNNIPGTNTKTVKVNFYWEPATTTSTHKVELRTILAQ